MQFLVQFPNENERDRALARLLEAKIETTFRGTIEEIRDGKVDRDSKPKPFLMTDLEQPIARLICRTSGGMNELLSDEAESA